MRSKWCGPQKSIVAPVAVAVAIATADVGPSTALKSPLPWSPVPSLSRFEDIFDGPLPDPDDAQLQGDGKRDEDGDYGRLSVHSTRLVAALQFPASLFFLRHSPLVDSWYGREYITQRLIPYMQRLRWRRKGRRLVSLHGIVTSLLLVGLAPRSSTA